MRKLLPLVVVSLLLSGCATGRTSGEDPALAQGDPCQDQVYLELKAAPPDSLSENEMSRLQDLERLCQQERQMERAQERSAATQSSYWRNYFLYAGVAAAAGVLAWRLLYF